MLGLSKIAVLMHCQSLAEETVEVLAIEEDVMTWAANNIDSLVDPVRIGG